MVNLECKFETLEQVCQAYMPFIFPMGLFIETSFQYRLGAELSISYFLPEALQSQTFKGSVIWINPEGGCDGRPAGIGLKPISDIELHKANFEKFLADKSKVSHLIFTM